jgi:hypothetical protein
MPMRMGFVDFENLPDSTIFSGTHDFEVIETEVDRPLPDDLFVLDFEEGVEVHDELHADVPLSYRYRKDRTPQEWQALIDQERRRTCGPNGCGTTRPVN